MTEERPNESRETREQTELTRRRILQTLSAGAVAAMLSSALSTGSASAQPGPEPAAEPLVSEGKIQRAVPLKAEEFNLADVRLLDGPFKQAQQRDVKYLLELEPDRMLHNFRVNAGLQPRAEVYGGWESVEPWIEIRCHGHTLGHYLSAVAMMYASTGEVRFKQRCDYCVSELKACQDATPSGLVCAFPDNAAQIENMVAGRRSVGVPWYTMHKIFAGLRDAHRFTDNASARTVLIRLADWADATTKDMTDEQMQRMLRTEHGGMNEVLADVYVLSGDQKYLKLSQRFCHSAVLDPLAESRDTLDNLHSNTQIPKFIGFQRLYTLTGDEKYDKASRFFWEAVTQRRAFVTGGNGDNEHFFPVAQFAQHLGSGKTMETCCSYNMLRLTRMRFELNPTAANADYYERTLYNAILASQDPDSGMMTYFQPTRPGYLKFYCTPTDSFWCCTGSGMENHSKYGDSIYFRDGQSLYVNLFIPSTLNWREKGVTITQTTTFPQEPRTKFQIKADQPTRLVINIRHPAWCEGASVKLNGTAIEQTSQPGSYLAIDRTWRDGDVIEVELPMKLRTEPLPGSPNTVAFVYGPIVLAGKLGTEGITPGADIIRNERTIGNVLNAQIEVPTLAGQPGEVLAKIKPVVGQPLTFQTQGIGRPRDVTLVPYYRIAHERYNLYWNTAAT